MLLANLLRNQLPGVEFTLLEVGARALGEAEPFYGLLQAFPASRLYGFEPEAELCAEMQKTAPPGVRYLPHALWERRERRPLYVTKHPMCSSLYEPDPRYIEAFMALDVQAVEKVVEVDTIDLDSVVREYGIPAPDFIKIDIQGAELDVFRGGTGALASVLQIVTEVEFAPTYRGQPLFGDVDRFLRERGFLFHRFNRLHGRMLKPLVLNNNPELHTQQLWTDALFVRDYLDPDRLATAQLLKAAVLADLYGSIDLAAWWLAAHDRRGAGAYREAYIAAVGQAMARQAGR